MKNKLDWRTGIIEQLAHDLAEYKAPEYRINAQQFFKEKLAQPSVIKAALVRKLSAKHFKTIKARPTSEIFDLCEELLQSNLEAKTAIAFDWAWRCRNQFAVSDFKRFESWIRKYVIDWGKCDHLCTGALGHLIYLFPKLTRKTIKWSRSKNRWMRRASAVCLIYSRRKEKPVKEVFEVADVLLSDDDDMVQKGYGWMLKEASNNYRDEVFEYVMKHKREMPRTALRYAIEKMPSAMRKRAMKKDW